MQFVMNQEGTQTKLYQRKNSSSMSKAKIYSVRSFYQSSISSNLTECDFPIPLSGEKMIKQLLNSFSFSCIAENSVLTSWAGKLSSSDKNVGRSFMWMGRSNGPTIDCWGKPILFRTKNYVYSSTKKRLAPLKVRRLEAK